MPSGLQIETLKIPLPWAVVAGTATDMTKMAAALSKIKGGLVAAYKRRSELSEEDISEMMTDETWLTAQDAVDVGFADRITGQAEEASAFAGHEIFALFRHVPERFQNTDHRVERPGRFRDERKQTMEITLELLEKEAADLLAEIRNQAKVAGYDLGLADGARNEVARIRAVKDQAMPGHEALIETLMWDGKTTGAEAAMAVVAAEKARLSKIRGMLDADAPAPVAPALPIEPTALVEDKDLPIAERAKATWDADPKLRNEFMGDFDVYLAYRKADEAGNVRILRKK